MDSDKPVKLIDSFRSLKDEHQKELFLKFLVNFSYKKIYDLEQVNDRINHEKNQLHQVTLLNKKLTNLLSEKINQLEESKMTLESELEQTIQNLIKAERLSTIGELSGRLAHDLRNPLSVIKMSVDLFKQKPDSLISDPTVQNKLNVIDESIARISHQIDDVLCYVRMSPLNLETINTHQLIVNSIDKMIVPSGVKIVSSESDQMITCDVVKIEAVLTNIILNSIQAMDSVGEIQINVKNQNDDILIDIVDSGPGILEENLPKIFEPLFTTKQTGTGLGLASCKSIIEQHGGTISVKNNPTTFTITLPKR